MMLPADSELCEHFCFRAIKGGFDAVLATVDPGEFGWRWNDRQMAVLPAQFGQCIANYTSGPVFWRLVGPSSKAELTIGGKIATGVSPRRCHLRYRANEILRGVFPISVRTRRWQTQPVSTINERGVG